MDTKSTSIVGAVVLGVLAIGLVLWYMSEHPAPFVNQREVGGQPTTTTSTPSAATSLDEHAKYYDITAAYPSSTPLPPQANAQAIEVMKQFAVNAITAFKEQGNFNNLSAQDIRNRACAVVCGVRYVQRFFFALIKTKRFYVLC